MAKRISLQEFQAGLARRLAEARDTRASALLAVQAGSRNWLLDLAEAGEILAVPPLAPVPLVHPWFRGLASVRGNLFGVVDFAAFHGEAPVVTGEPAKQAADREMEFRKRQKESLDAAEKGEKLRPDIFIPDDFLMLAPGGDIGDDRRGNRLQGCHGGDTRRQPVA